MAISNGQALVQVRRAGDIWWADGFDSGNIYLTGQTSGVSWTTAASRISDGSYGLNHSTTDNGGSFITKTGLSNISEIIFGLAIKINSFGGINAGACLIQWTDITSVQLSLNISTTGALFFQRTSAGATLGTTLATTGVAAVTTGVYHWIDGKIKIHNTSGYVEARMNGVPVCSASSINTRNATNNYINGFILNNSDCNTNYGLVMDDLYMIYNPDDTVPYPGDIRVYDIVPSADGFYQNFTPSTGTSHYAMVDELGAVNDADYLTANVADLKETHTYTDLPVNAVNVYGTMLGLRAQKTDAGTRTMRYLVRQGGVDYEYADQADISLANSFANYFFFNPINPATGDEWTISDINNFEGGFKIQS